ncbi:hypothetical protein MH117_03230 [Paenibacillus sp. ACRRX]|uniref:hypothetical protein n=2 Tax=unclassified Paenibacillus TaxID=185978 RepID=UPI001EF6DC82|nr:hypothetical protein [Paenibacillus sp. ACRRX]MCG7406416.1 hypothetical protein [Paenibacillus sp. ACRRX]
MSKMQMTRHKREQQADALKAESPLEPSFVESRALKALSQLKQQPAEEEVDEQAAADDEEIHKSLLEEEEDRSLPPRQILFPSNYGRLAKWFYNLLFLLFIGLLVALLFWGRHTTMEGY